MGPSQGAVSYDDAVMASAAGALLVMDLAGGTPAWFQPTGVTGLRLSGMIFTSAAGAHVREYRIVGKGQALDPHAWQAAFNRLGGAAIQLFDEQGRPVPVSEIGL